MRKAAWFFVAAILAGAAASPAKADNIKTTSSGSSFKHNDTLNWNSLGNNNYDITDGTVATSQGGLKTTIDYTLGEPGSTLVECPATNCTWTGNFSPDQTLLASIDHSTGKGDGTIDLSFSDGLGGVGFQIQPNSPGAFQAEITAYDGANLLGTFYETGQSNRDENNSAIFFGLEDLTGADITSIQVNTIDCEGGALPHCSNQFAINGLELFKGGGYSNTPEPASLLLLASGLGALGLLRRKLATN